MSSTRNILVSGVLYTAMAKYAGIVVSLAVAGVLSRLLPPADFGIVAIATVIITFFGIFSDLGIAPAIVQYKELQKNELRDIFSFTLWSGLAISLLFFACAPLIASYYDSPRLEAICRLLSLNLFFAAANIVPSALLFKEKRFRFIALRNLSVQATGGVIAVGAALGGAGIYALLINPIFSSFALLIVNLREHPMLPRLSAGFTSLRRIFAFSAYQFSFNLINYFTRNLDKLLIGKYMGMSPLGYYEKSYRLMMLPLQNITHVVSPVMHPVFSDFRDDMSKLSENYLKVVRLLALIGFPLSAVLCFTGRELILLIFGSQWIESVPVFRILALSVGIQIILSTSGSIFQAAGATKTMFLSGLLSAVLNVGAILAGIFHFGTLEAVAWCICASFTVNFVQSYYLMYYRTFRLSWRPFWTHTLAALPLALFIGGLLWGVGLLLPADHLLLSLIVKGALALSLWLLYIQLSGIYDIRAKITGMLRRGRTSDPSAP